MTHEYDNCIIELQKPEKERNIPVILKYIQTLKGFVNILKLTNEDFNFNLTECSKIINYSQKEKDIIIVEEGDRGDSFFLNIRLVWAYPGIIFASKSIKKEFYGDIKTKTEEDGFALSRRTNC